MVVPVVAVAVPRQSAPSASPPSVAQSNAPSKSSAYEIYHSPQLGFRIAYPKSYTVDTSKEGEGYLRFSRNVGTPQASAAETTAAAPESDRSGSIIAATFENPKGLSALEWAKQNDKTSYFQTGRQGNYQSRKFAGQPAIAYSWCATECGDNIVFPSRDGRRIIVLSALYDLPGDDVRWEFQNVVGKFRFN
jgi:hypothetical protein